MSSEEKIKNNLIAPCGMNCGLCYARLREKNRCPGCRQMDKDKPAYCRKCIIRNCPVLKKKKMKYCSSKCEKFPCKRLKDLDKRYRGKYHMSMIENLEYIEKHGIRKFVKNERKRWQKGGKVFCVHHHKYY